MWILHSAGDGAHRAGPDSIFTRGFGGRPGAAWDALVRPRYVFEARFDDLLAVEWQTGACSSQARAA